MSSDIENEEPSSSSLFPENGNGKKRNVSNGELPEGAGDRTTKRARRAQEDEDERTIAELERLVPVQQKRVKYRQVLHHIPQDVPYVPVQTESGNRVYLRLLAKKGRSRDEFELDMEDEEEESGRSRKLISTDGGSNRRLFPNWEQIKRDARVLKEKFHNNVADIVDAENLGVPKEEEDLWVEKYKPRSFLDLLSELSTNKMLLHWLKLWDKSVFGNDYLAKTKLTKEKFANLEAKEKAQKEKKFWFNKNKGPPAPVVEEEYDDMGRPKLKVALLYGPPGLGKTTCAHVVARQAGYSVKEMNASDDRSMEIFRKTLDDALQSKSEIFQGGKPNCLVIDEIDGAPVATVNVLIELISGNATEKGKKKLKKVLKRPVICICNDLYAPSLKELRKHAVVLQFIPIEIPVLAGRLHEISSKEKLQLDDTTIKTLCEKSECDIRSCLSTLQFLKKKKCNPKDAIFAQIGMKDKAKGLFAVWSDIFLIPEGKKKYSDGEDPAKPGVRFKNVLKVVQNYGDYEKLMTGVFENYLRVRFNQVYFESILEGLSWTNWFHDLQATIDHSQNYVLFGYLPIYFVACHFLYGQRSWFRINFPATDVISKCSRSRSIVSGLFSEVTPAVGRFSNVNDLVADVVPSLINIIQPSTIRPVPTQIWSPRERETLRNIVDIMIAYNLSYTQTRNPDTGAYTFNLEPDIETVSRFKIQDNQISKRTFPYAVKQFVAREIEQEKMRRSDNHGEGGERSVDPVPGPSTAKKSPPQEFKAPKPVVKTVSPKVHIDPSKMVRKDFFGRIVPASEQTKQDMIAQQKRSAGIYFRFKEGYSNAVRRPVKMKDLE